MNRHITDEDGRWYKDRAPEALDFNCVNTIALFEGSIMTACPLIDRDGIGLLIQEGSAFTLVDARGEQEFNKGHICGAVHISAESIEEAAPPMLSRDAQIIVYSEDSMCAASAVAADKLITLGYTNVKRYEGGIFDWYMSENCVETHKTAA